MRSSLCMSYLYFSDCSYNGIDHSNANLNSHSKMTTNNNVNFQQTCEEKIVPGY